MSDDFADTYTEEVFEQCADGVGVTIDDFVAYKPAHTYIFMPCCEMWVAASVNSLDPVIVRGRDGQPKKRNGKIVTISASRWLDQNRPVVQMTWCPGQPKLITGRLVVDGGWIERQGVTVFNLYRPPRLDLGDATQVGSWLDHIARIFNADDARHIVNWLAHRVQHPADKINHALVLGGAQGIGKDTLLEPLKYAVGPWNFHEVSPSHMLGRFNSFVRSVILRVNEARDLGDAERINRFSFYDHTKIYTACPPDVLRVDEKHLREYYVFNCLGFLITTNHKTDGIFLPADDRRHYVAWSDRTKEDFTPDYWNRLWAWYGAGGYGHVAAYLAELDLSGFDPKAPPPKTAAFWDIVGANIAPEDDDLANLLETMKHPDGVTLALLISNAKGAIAEWLMDRKHRRSLPHRLERCGYVSARNPGRDDGLWRIEGERQRVYVKATFSADERLRAARKLTEG